MQSNVLVLFSAALLLFGAVGYAGSYDADTVGTGEQSLVMTFIGHGTLMFQYAGKVVHVDPTLRESDYQGLPRADLILITHEHGDHLDPAAVEKLRKSGTIIVANSGAAGKIKGALVMKNGETRTAAGFKIEAVPAYNIIHKRDDGQPYHPKGNGNGYVITCGARRVYVAGDTEYVPEMDGMQAIDIAFLPMNLPYTMTVEMGAEAARAIRPKILYPYHYGDSEVSKLAGLLEGARDIELRIRELR